MMMVTENNNVELKTDQNGRFRISIELHFDPIFLGRVSFGLLVKIFGL